MLKPSIFIIILFLGFPKALIAQLDSLVDQQVLIEKITIEGNKKTPIVALTALAEEDTEKVSSSMVEPNP